MKSILQVSTTIIATFLLLFPNYGEGNPGFQWPMIRGQYPELYGITSTFGESRSDHFHTGVDISGMNMPVHPLQSGKILFSRHIDDMPYQPMPGAGNYVIIDHGNGWWSGYFHLLSLGDKRNGQVSLNDEIGMAGNTGHSYGAHLHFFITSDNGKNYVNPLKLLPPVTDLNPPVIGQLVIRTPEGTTMISHSRQENIRLTKEYPVQVIAIDPGLEKSTRRGIYRLQWRLNGGRTENMTFDRISYNPDGWMLNEKTLFDSVFVENDYNIGNLDFQNGSNILEMTATDFSGNTTGVTYNINVTREY